MQAGARGAPAGGPPPASLSHPSAEAAALYLPEKSSPRRRRRSCRPPSSSASHAAAAAALVHGAHGRGPHARGARGGGAAGSASRREAPLSSGRAHTRARAQWPARALGPRCVRGALKAPLGRPRHDPAPGAPFTRRPGPATPRPAAAGARPCPPRTDRKEAAVGWPERAPPPQDGRAPRAPLPQGEGEGEADGSALSGFGPAARPQGLEAACTRACATTGRRRRRRLRSGTAPARSPARLWPTGVASRRVGNPGLARGRTPREGRPLPEDSRLETRALALAGGLNFFFFFFLGNWSPAFERVVGGEGLLHSFVQFSKGLSLQRPYSLFE